MRRTIRCISGPVNELVLYNLTLNQENGIASILTVGKRGIVFLIRDFMLFHHFMNYLTVKPAFRAEVKPGPPGRYWKLSACFGNDAGCAAEDHPINFADKLIFVPA